MSNELSPYQEEIKKMNDVNKIPSYAKVPVKREAKKMTWVDKIKKFFKDKYHSLLRFLGIE